MRVDRSVPCRNDRDFGWIAAAETSGDDALRGVRARPWKLVHKADRRSLATVFVTVALLVAPQWLALGTGTTIVWIVLTFLACCASHVVVHNHCHVPIFANDAANRGFNLAASLARGHCASDVYLAHNVNHHAQQGRAGDWIAPTLGGTGHAVLRLLRFIVRAAVSMARERNRLPGKGRALIAEPFRSSLPREKVFLPIAVLILLVHDVHATLLHAVLPWAGALAWLVGVNFIQHEECTPDSEFAHSRNFTGRSTNWLLFNNGYHTAHHAAPGLHWHDLPAAHARLADRIPARLCERSATRYMIRRYLRAGSA